MKKRHVRKKFKQEEKSYNNRITKKKKTKKVEMLKNVQSNDIKRVAFLRSTNPPMLNLTENPGIYKKIKNYCYICFTFM